jgi:hypothetical protein
VVNERSRTWYAANTEKHALHVKNWQTKNADKFKADVAAYRAANRERLDAASIIWRKSNPDKILASVKRTREKHRDKILERDRQWRQRNKHKVNAKKSRREAAKLRAIPKWADLKAIEAIYALAQKISKETGIPHHVDHIYPLMSKVMCGLHVETNLEVIPAAENISKGNRRWPAQPIDNLQSLAVL